MTSGRSPRVSERIYAALLVLYPKEFRDAYGDQIVQVFRDEFREVSERAGKVGLVALWVRTILDLLSTGLAERRRTNAATDRVERLMNATRWSDFPRSMALFFIALNAFVLALLVYVVGSEGLKIEVAVVTAFNLTSMFINVSRFLYSAHRRVAATLLYVASFPVFILGAGLFAAWTYQRGEEWMALFFLAIVFAAISHLVWQYLFSTGADNARQG